MEKEKKFFGVRENVDRGLVSCVFYDGGWGGWWMLLIFLRVWFEMGFLEMFENE